MWLTQRCAEAEFFFSFIIWVHFYRGGMLRIEIPEHGYTLNVIYTYQSSENYMPWHVILCGMNPNTYYLSLRVSVRDINL